MVMMMMCLELSHCPVGDALCHVLSVHSVLLVLVGLVVQMALVTFLVLVVIQTLGLY